ncbi:uncharacterized protein GGS25DRAFT_533434 [Hypoxylon fragiforme]|uniref:uncharacterized protein n=1 Tax=Hypoxylon fragiforme TaxID=63214 RepID=UPI0020C66090|nr:uncharacterized protein GGS25DRAFT_533434 [Hypoxylon fragiforme]KAI2606358.1 hypothetical protein GGS25DRAFT_533434 [Hypoxylon fragiforme]
MKCLSTFYTALYVAASTSVVSAQDFSGSGEIHIINSTDFGSATPAESIGCLDVNGAFTTSLDSGCATFTRLAQSPGTVSTDAGNCSFTDASQPANTDNPYGANSYAWHCRPDFAAAATDSLYTVKGFNYPFLCHGDINCYYDVKNNMISRNGTAPVWGYVWGSRQTTIPAGHSQVLWYWKQTSTDAAASGES